MLKNKKGFTMIELLAAITLLLIVAAILVPSIASISDTVKETQYNSQKELIRAAGREYGEDNLNSLNDTTCTDITIESLITNGYLKANSDNKTTIKNAKTGENMNNEVVCLKYGYFSSDSVSTAGNTSTKYHYKVNVCIKNIDVNCS